MDHTPGLKNKIGRIGESLDTASKSADRLTKATNRFTLALVLVALAALGFEVYKYFDVRDREQQASTGFRMPVANPPLEPDRPDLIEEPKIED